MLLRNDSADRAFKQELASFVTDDTLDCAALISFLKSGHDYDRLGEAFRLLASEHIEDAKAEVQRGFQEAIGSDNAALFALHCVIMLVPYASAGLVRFGDLPPQALYYRVNLFEHINELVPDRFSEQSLATLEVEAMCVPSIVSLMRIGKRGPNRLADLLYGSPADQTLALDLLDRAHAAKVTGYDSCYSDLIVAKANCGDARLRQRIESTIDYIQQNNSREVLPNVLAAVLASIRTGERAEQAFTSELSTLNLTNEDMIMFALAIAENLSNTGQSESATQVLSAAAKYVGSDLKATA